MLFDYLACVSLKIIIYVYLSLGTKALYKVEKILTNKRVLTDGENLSSKYQT